MVKLPAELWLRIFALAASDWGEHLHLLTTMQAMAEVLQVADVSSTTVWRTITDNASDIPAVQTFRAGSVSCLPLLSVTAIAPVRSFDRQLLAVGTTPKSSDEWDIELWDVNDPSGEPLGMLVGHTRPVVALAERCGVLVSGGLDKTVRLWDLAAGRCIDTQTVRPCSDLSERDEGDGNIGVRIVACSEAHLACYVDREWAEVLIDVYDVGGEWNPQSTSAAYARSLAVDSENGRAAHDGDICALAALPRGGLASGGEDERVRLWELSSGECTATLEVGAPVYSLCVAAQQRVLASGDAAGWIKVWCLETAACLHSFQAHGNEQVNCLAPHSSSGGLVSCGHDACIRVWSPARPCDI